MSIERLQEWNKKHPWYHSWYDAKARCENPKDIAYDWYGGKGIKMLMKLKDFEFLWKRDMADAMKCPSIDRINSSGHYELSNCRFIELSQNRHRSHMGCSERKRNALIKNGAIAGFRKGRIPWNKGKHPEYMQGKNHFMYGKHPVAHNKGKKFVDGKYISGSQQRTAR